MSPRGRVLDQPLVKELAAEEALTILCGRYEGVDQRLLDAHGFEEISVGDYVLSGGEPAAMILMDACIRLLPGVMGNNDTADNESFGSATGGLLEYPHYTRPADWIAADGQSYSVPAVLKSGDHGKIAQWRQEQSESITRAIGGRIYSAIRAKTTCAACWDGGAPPTPNISRSASNSESCALRLCSS